MERIVNGVDHRTSRGRRVAKAFSGASLGAEDRIANYFLWVQPDTLMRLYSSEFRERLVDRMAQRPLSELLADIPDRVARLERMLALEQRFFLADHNLNYTDKMSMASGVETRVPFLDLALVDFAARIPARFKQRGRVGKWVLKKAMEPYLPREVIYRPKTGFGAPLRRWLRHDLRDLRDDLLSGESFAAAGFLTRWLFDNSLRPISPESSTPHTRFSA